MPSMVSDRERRAEERKRKEREIQRRRMNRYIEDQAEQGSDNEENDDVRKKINRDDDEEYDGDDLDDDLDGFVVRGDDEEVEDANQTHYDKLREMDEMLDKEQIARTLQAVVYGDNKKRRRGEMMEDEELMDEATKLRRKIMEERIKEMQKKEAHQLTDQVLQTGEINLD